MGKESTPPKKQPLNPEGNPKMSVSEWLGLPAEEIDPIIDKPNPPAEVSGGKKEPHIHTLGDGTASEGIENMNGIRKGPFGNFGS